jgi:F-type H+-transporting ATPase subunit alpha
LDDETRKIIEHGRRIRACLKQPDFAPITVPAQITVLLALTANLFDAVPLDQMTDAGHAVREAAATISAEVSARFETAAKLSDGDKKTIIEIARKALVPFQPKPEPQAEVKPAAKADSKQENKAKIDAKANPEVEVETKPKVAAPPAEVKPSAEVESKGKS